MTKYANNVRRINPFLWKAIRGHEDVPTCTPIFWAILNFLASYDKEMAQNLEQVHKRYIKARHTRARQSKSADKNDWSVYKTL